jgi:ribosomal protein S12 methylthiotransferase accessory factor
LIRYASSYRAVSLDLALARARQAQSRFGITRVTEVTHLDRASVPVFASIRPGACEGSLCVHAGKGLTVAEARVGATMEAIEFAYAEPARSRVPLVSAPPRRVLDGRRRPDAILDLCPLAGIAIPNDARLRCVEADDLEGGRVLVPAELVFFPFSRPSNEMFFGATTNGLASGWSLVEATVHALCEVIERDVLSFERFHVASRPIDARTLPAPLREVKERLHDRGFDTAIRWIPNDFGVACVRALMWERESLDPISVSEGSGCHLDPKVAATRALTEAAQSRLTLIHGARDDIAGRYAKIRRWSGARKRAFSARVIEAMRRGDTPFDFSRAPNPAAGCRSLDDVLSAICDGLRRSGIRRVLRVRLSDADDLVHVVRVLVPGLEFFTEMLPRVGRRLARYVEKY